MIWGENDIVEENGIVYLKHEVFQKFWEEYGLSSYNLLFTNNIPYDRALNLKKMILSNVILDEFRKNEKNIKDEFDLYKFLTSNIKNILVLENSRTITLENFKNIYKLIRDNCGGKVDYKFSDRDIKVLEFNNEIKRIKGNNNENKTIELLSELISNLSSIEDLDLFIKALKVNGVEESEELANQILAQKEKLSVVDKICKIIDNEGINNEVEFYKLLLDRKKYCDKPLNLNQIMNYGEKVSKIRNIIFNRDNFEVFVRYSVAPLEELMRTMSNAQYILKFLEINKKYNIYSIDIVQKVLDKINLLSNKEEVYEKLKNEPEKYYGSKEILELTEYEDKINKLIEVSSPTDKKIYIAIKEKDIDGIFKILSDLGYKNSSEMIDYLNGYFKKIGNYESIFKYFEQQIKQIEEKKDSDKLVDKISELLGKGDSPDELYGLLLESSEQFKTYDEYIEMIDDYVEKIKGEKGLDIYSKIDKDKLKYLFALKESFKGPYYYFDNNADDILQYLEDLKKYKISIKQIFLPELYDKIDEDESKIFLSKIKADKDKYYYSEEIIKYFELRNKIRELYQQTSDDDEKEIYQKMMHDEKFSPSKLIFLFAAKKDIDCSVITDKVYNCLNKVSIDVGMPKEEFLSKLEEEHTKQTGAKKTDAKKDSDKLVDKISELLSKGDSPDELYGLLLESSSMFSKYEVNEYIKSIDDYVEKIKGEKCLDIYSIIDKDKLKYLFGLKKDFEGIHYNNIKNADDVLKHLEEFKKYKISLEGICVSDLCEIIGMDESKIFLIRIKADKDKYYGSEEIIKYFERKNKLKELSEETSDADEKEIYNIISRTTDGIGFTNNNNGLIFNLIECFAAKKDIDCSMITDKIYNCLDKVSFDIGIPKEKFLSELEKEYEERHKNDKGKLKILSRRKAKNMVDKKKVFNALVLGTSVSALLYMTFVLGTNPVVAIANCVTAINNLINKDSSLKNTFLSLGSSSAYFASIIVSFKMLLGKNKNKDDDNQNLNQNGRVR